MFRRVVFQFLLIVSALLLVVKPLIGFTLYHQAKTQGENEFITVIKAFSKRKQEYLDWEDVKDSICLTVSASPNFVIKVREFLIIQFFDVFFPSASGISIGNFDSWRFLSLDRLYLRNLQLTL